MEPENENLIQIEVFHVSGNSSLEDVYENFMEGVADGLELILAGHTPPPSRLKTECRFYDERNRITAYVKKWKRLVDISFADFNRLQCGEVRGWRRWILLQRMHILEMRIERARKRVCTRALAALAAALASGLPVAVGSNGDFRPVDANEEQEVLERVRNQKRMWIFVFAQNRLCAEDNLIVASLM